MLFFKQKTAYEMRISDWSSDVCSSDLSATVAAAFAYLAFGSMFLGFFAWYRGLAIGGIARVGQVQLLQPFLTVVAAALLFHEVVEPMTFDFAVAVIAIIAGGRHAKIGRAHV